jgi:ParB-like chromosome segregation protein Spo0J
MVTETVPIDGLTPDPANARVHSERNLSAIIASLRTFGQQKPIVVDSRGVVIAGNGTLEAAKRIGWTEISIVKTHLDPTQATAFGIADNRTAELAEWDDDVLRSLLDSMDEDLLEVLDVDGIAKDVFDKNEPSTRDLDIDAIQWRVVVEVRDEEHQAEVIEKLEREGLVCQPLMS